MVEERGVEAIPQPLRAYHRFICPECETLVKAIPSRVNGVDGVVVTSLDTYCKACKVLTKIHFEGMDTHYRAAMDEHFRILAEQAAAAEEEQEEESAE